MDTKEIQKNSRTMSQELIWLDNLITERLNNYFKSNGTKYYSYSPPCIENYNGNYSTFIKKNNFNRIERLIIISCLATNYYPQIFDKFLIKNKGIDKRFTEFGGRIDEKNSRFIPTLETISFIMHGKDFESKFKLQSILDDDHIFNKNGIIRYDHDEFSKNPMSRVLNLSDEILQHVTTGKTYRPNMSIRFPAKILESPHDWEDLVLNPLIFDEVENINTWIRFRSEIEGSKLLRKKINSGYKCLFYGPPGTGKTLTTSLLGKHNKKDVYRIDLSQVISKYVGETEKNLSQIFNAAENKDWILFFDEAESLFSKRTAVSDSKDKFANQQTAYLLQRIEDFNGLVILATNLKPNIDNAFSRRIQSTIHFTLPDYSQRRILWSKALEGVSDLDTTTIKDFAKDYEISGGSIKNVIQFSWLLSKRNNKKLIGKKELIQGIKRELNKDGKSLEF